MDTNIDSVMGRLTPYLDIFDAILRHGHAAYEEYPPSVVIDHDASTQAHCTYRHILAEAHRVFDEHESARHLEIRGQNLWMLEDVNAVIRFKKTDEDGRSSNYPTKQARDFDRGRTLPRLPADPTRLNVGYLLDETGIGYERSQIAIPAGNSTLWCAAIIPQEDREADAACWLDVTRQPRLKLG